MVRKGNTVGCVYVYETVKNIACIAFKLLLVVLGSEIDLYVHNGLRMED